MGKKQIAVLTSGDDAPEMNMAVRSVIRTVFTDGMGVLGVHRGCSGLPNCDVEEIDLRSVSDIIHNGGTVLYTVRSPKFNSPGGVQKATENCRKLGIGGLIVIGGDGSFHGARDLTQTGIPCIGVPGTTDGDVTCSEYIIGYDTAVSIAMRMVDHLCGITKSHDHCSTVEVTGRRYGDIALNTRTAVGVMAILVSEQPCDLERGIYQRIQYTQHIGKRHPVIVMTEGAGCHVEELTKEIGKNTDIETRAMILGRVQRDGSPSLRNRVVATQMGYHTAKLLEDGEGSRVVAMQRDQIADFNVTEALEVFRRFDMELYRIAMKVSI